MNAPLRFWLLILAIAVSGMLLRLYYAGEPLWLDELHTAWCVDSDMSQVANRAGQGNQAPLFFWLTELVTSVLATIPLFLRLISVFCGTLAILGGAVCVYYQKPNVWAASLTAALIAIDQWLLFYSSEARPYAMLQIIALLQFLMFMSLTAPSQNVESGSSKSRYVAFAFLTTALLSTHLTGGLLIVTELIILVLARSKAAKSVLMALSIGCALAVPVLLFAIDVFGNREQWHSDSNPKTLIGSWLLPLSLQLAPAIAIVGYDLLRAPAKEQNESIKFSLFYFVALAVAPLIVAAILHYLSIPLASYRYTTISSLAPPICIGLAAALIRERSVAIAFVLLILLVNLVANPVVQAAVKDRQLPAFRNENWHSAIEYVNQLERPRLVLLMSNLYEDSRAREDDSDEFQRYLRFPVSSIYALNAGFEVIPVPTRDAKVLDESQIDKCIENDGAIFICRVARTRMRQIEHELKRAFAGRKHQTQIETMEQPGNLLKVIVVTLDK